MSSYSIAGVGFLMVLPILIAQWIGVIGLAKSGRGGAWWAMMLGTTVTTLGSLMSPLLLYMMVSGTNGLAGGNSLQSFSLWLGGISGFSTLGSLTFAIGFAVHGLGSAKLQSRVRELETVLEAQGEQLASQQSPCAKLA